MPDRSSTEQRVPQRVIVPFAGAAILGLLVVLLPGPDTDWVLFGVAAALTVAIAAAGLVAARLRRGRVLIVVLPLAYFFVVAILRHSGTTGASGFAPLVMLPIVWLALFGTRRDLLIGLGALAVTLLAPFLVYGEPRYPATGWRNSVLWLMVAALTGLSIQSLVVRLRMARDRLSGVLDASTEIAFIATDPEGTITVFNTGAERLLGYRADEMIGKVTPKGLYDPAEVVARANELGIFPGYEAVLQSARRGVPEYRQWTYIRKDGSRVRVGVTTTAEFAPDGSITGFLAVAKDVTARIRAERARQQALDSAVEASRAKSEFLANMSHEIRTPLNGVMGMLELLMDTELDARPARVRAHGRDLRRRPARRHQRRARLLEDRGRQAGARPPRRRPAAPWSRTRAGCSPHQAHAKGVELTSWIDDQMPPVVRGDGGRLRQVLVNLVSNAVKFTEAGEVSVRAGATALEGGDLQLHVAVTDSGIGIAPERLPDLFNAFSQEDNSTTRRFGGTGLGLAISRQLVEMMGGELTAASEPGEGSTFRFTARVQASSAERPTRRPRASFPEGLRVLVVDDSRTNREIVRGYLHPRVTRCEQAETVQDALLLLHTAASAGEPYELVVLDLHMPGMDGLELAHAIRKSPSLRAARLIVLTSTATHREAARKARIDGYLTKPVRRASLLEAVADVFAPRQPVAPAVGREPQPQDDAAAAPGRRILIAEDNPVNQLVIQGMLAKRGYEVDVAVDGADALAQLDRERHVAVFMDIQMPGLDGYETTRRIRAAENGIARIPIVAMTAGALEGDRERAIEAGMDDYVTKPLRPEQIDAVLERWAGGPSPAELDEPVIDDGPDPPLRRGLPRDRRAARGAVRGIDAAAARPARRGGRARRRGSDPHALAQAPQQRRKRRRQPHGRALPSAGGAGCPARAARRRAARRLPGDARGDPRRGRGELSPFSSRRPADPSSTARCTRPGARSHARPTATAAPSPAPGPQRSRR